jgi:hypothetical protein
MKDEGEAGHEFLLAVLLDQIAGEGVVGIVHRGVLDGPEVGQRGSIALVHQAPSTA